MMGGAVLAFGLGLAAWADAPQTSPRPLPRPEGLGVVVPLVAVPVPVIKPRPRPKVAAVAIAPTKSAAMLRVRPRPKPALETRRAAVVTSTTPALKAGRKGSVCGNTAIKGTPIAPIAGKLKGCGLAEGVKVTSVAGVTLSPAAIIDCPTAEALRSWVEKGVKPAVGKTGGGVVGLQVAASYSCRSRNNVKGAKISEHGRGHAVDIKGIVLHNGTVVTVLKDWKDGKFGKILKAMHKTACGPFGTVLGPGSDGHHRDHLHMDTVRYRSGRYCK